MAACRAEASVPLAYGRFAAAGLPYAGAYGQLAPIPAAYAAVPSIYNAAPLAVAAPIAVAASLAKAVVPAPIATPAVAAPSVHSSQYRAGDELGNNVFGYSNINSARQEQSSPAGVTGSYSYVDEAGLHTRHYVADAFGFRVTGDNVPVGRKRRSVAYASPLTTAYAAAPYALGHIAAPLAATYAAAPLAATYAAAPFAATYAAAPLAATYAATPLAATYGAAPLAAAPLAATYAAAPYAAPVASREAVLTTIQLNPGHAVSYRVD